MMMAMSTKISELTQQCERLVEELKRYGAERVILFGSVARGEADEHSDLDVVVVKATDMGFVDRLSDVVRRCPSAGGADILVYTPGEFQQMQQSGNPFLDCVLRDGKVLYEAT